jgi:cytochrome d ubiquinol oxidase subunit I
LNPEKKSYNDTVPSYLYKVEIPKLLSFLGYRDANAFVPGLKDIIEGGYETPSGKALSFDEKESVEGSIQALADYQYACQRKIRLLL